MVGAWGYFLIQGVRDPLGGINSLWPLFGIANQMLAAIALCLATTIILKMQLPSEPKVEARESRTGKPVLALITLVPLVWLVAVTFTAGAQKIWSSDGRIGFLAQAQTLTDKMSALNGALESAEAASESTAIDAAQKALQTSRTLQFNDRLDAAVAGTFLALVIAIVLLSLREWILLLSRRKPAVLHETDPVWLPDYAVAEDRPLHLAGTAALALALAKEWSGESHLERAHQHAVAVCQCHPANAQQIYVEATEQRFDGVRRCC
jgi:carbon starvation protein